MRHQLSEVHDSMSGRKAESTKKGIRDFNAKNYKSLKRLGIVLDDNSLNTLASYRYSMDSQQQAPVTVASIPNLVQFLQNWVPGVVRILTAARKADEAIGIATIGSFEDEQVVVTVIEDQASAVPYGDTSDIPLASFNANYNAFTVVRLSIGTEVNILEEARGSRQRINVSDEKRISCSEALEIGRNTIAFFGYNSTNNQTYGILNNPNLPAYYTVPNGVSGSPLWSTKTFLEITADIRGMISRLLTNSQERANPEDVETTLLLPTNSVVYLTVVSNFGISVRDWLTQTYPKIRVVSAPQLNGANGGANVAYLYADEVLDSGTDGGDTWLQPVPAKLMLTGVEKLVKGYREGYLNATAGAIVKRPFAVVRASGI